MSDLGYSIHLQRIIEAICHGTPLRDDAKDGAPHHYKMAVDYLARQAALSPQEAAPGAVGVKKLEWGEERQVTDEPWGKPNLRQYIGLRHLGPVSGSYSVQELEPGGKWGWWDGWSISVTPTGVEATVDAAKAAAQADYERRIDGALEPRSASPPLAVEALREARPPMTLDRPSDRPEWEQVNRLFERHNSGVPNWRLRDELVTSLAWARYGELLDKSLGDSDGR